MHLAARVISLWLSPSKAGVQQHDVQRHQGREGVSLITLFVTLCMFILFGNQSRRSLSPIEYHANAAMRANDDARCATQVSRPGALGRAGQHAPGQGLQSGSWQSRP